MQIFTNFESVKNLKKPISLTIGMFDGMHLGHQKIFDKLKELTKGIGSIVVITFENHPIEMISKETLIPKICNIDEKLEHLKEAGVFATYLLKFDESIRELSFEEFIKKTKEAIDFEFLVLGDGASFGKNQKGNEESVKALESRYQFKAFYLQKCMIEGETVSSKKIRELLQQGHMETASKFLGRNYTLYAPFQIEKLQEAGENLLKIGFNFVNHCGLPSGHYLVNIKSEPFSTKALAFLTALESENHTQTFELEIHIKGSKGEYMNDKVKIEFLKKIESPDEVKDVVGHNSKIEKFTQK